MLRHLLLAGLCFISTGTFAESETYNRVDFQVEAAREVANDLLTATMTVEVQDRQPDRVAQLMNSRLNEALKLAASYTTVKTSSGNQSTHPVYGKSQQIDAWRGHGEIRLESSDFKAAGELIMKLQSTLQLGGIQFSVSPDACGRIENELVTEAITAFKARAMTISEALGARSYKIVQLSIQGSTPPHYPMPMMRAAGLAAAMPEPEFASGDSRMTVSVSGTIETE